MATKCISKSWADTETASSSSSSSCPSLKLSYASVASKGLVKCESVRDSVRDSDFIVVSHKKDMEKKCESAVLQWAKNRSQSSKPSSKCIDNDDEIICSHCSTPFIFGVKMKERYTTNGWKAPKICKMCSQLRYEKKAKA